MKARPVKITHQRGEYLVRVPLSRNGEKEATVSYEDYHTLLSLGVSPNWQLTGGSVVARTTQRVLEGPEVRTQGRQVLIGRILMNAKAGQQVRYKDGNSLNLRRDNLMLRNGGFSLRNDREELSITPV